MSDTPTPWQSLDELEDHAGAAGEDDPAMLLDRRMAMRLMAASAALAAAACDRPPSRALRSAPRTISTGRFVDYATTLDQNGLGFGVIARTADGRPVKLEGNPLHPASLGGSNVMAQAALLSLYDPHRSRQPVRQGRPVDWAEARRALGPWLQAIRLRQGEGLHLLLQPTASPTLERVAEQVAAALPGARWYGHRPIEEAPSAGGADWVPLPGEAELIVSIGCDFLGPGPAQVRLARDWAARRQQALASGQLPRLVVAESLLSLTGARADRRIILPPDRLASLAHDLEAALAGGTAAPPVRELARALASAGPRALLLAGRDQPAEVQAAARRINTRLGAVGTTLRPIAPNLRLQLDPLLPLAQALVNGTVADLVILGGNPAHDAPADLAMADILRLAQRSIHLGYTLDETALACTWHLPASHQLERWGDLRSFDGSVGLVQPVTQRLAPGLSEIEFLALLAGGRPDGRSLLRTTWAGAVPDEEAWLRALEAGVLPVATEPPEPAPPPDPSTRVARSNPAPGELALVFHPAGHLWDGGDAGNAWLQELPDPITKLVWGNAATLAPATAARLGLANGDEVEIRVGERRLAAPVWIAPGQAEEVVGLGLGHGRKVAGAIGSGIGVNAYALRTAANPWTTVCEVVPTGRRQRLVGTQRHHPTGDPGAVRRVSPGERASPPPRPSPSLYADRDPQGQRRWAMAIDLNACIGCGACTIACQAENNIPVVGPDEVARGREMHWIRVDRYFSGEPAAPETSFQPVPCMHCETAPCEPVCPVDATVHSSEGLNQMVYNRCIGTRSCSNNCPYKVRRFNWFDYQGQPTAAPEPMQNPRVLIRDRGVMEKCTYCVQRIEAVHTGDEPGPPVTACQQACPTQAIRFGDLADPASRVSEDRQDPRHYALLDGLNLFPRTTYLARVDGHSG